MSLYLKIIVFIIDTLNKLTEYMAKKHKINEVDNVVKAVDTHNDDELARQLRDIAKKVEERNKLS